MREFVDRRIACSELKGRKAVISIEQLIAWRAVSNGASDEKVRCWMRSNLENLREYDSV